MSSGQRHAFIVGTPSYSPIDGRTACPTRQAAGEDKRYRNGKPRRIRLDRFKPGSTGYKLVGGEVQ